MQTEAMTTEGVTDSRTLAEVIDAELRARADPTRAEKEKAYLKSALTHYGVSVPDTRAVVTDVMRGIDFDHDAVVGLATELWSGPVGERPSAAVRQLRSVPIYERRSAAVMVLVRGKGHLSGADADLIEAFIREAGTWALVDPLAGDLAGPLADASGERDQVLERWAVDEDFWVRRAALLAHLRPLRVGAGDFERFSRFADAMLEEREFFIRKAIGWVLRDTAKKRPDLIFEWLLPRAHRASGVTVREALRPLSPDQQTAIRSTHQSGRSSHA